MTYCGAWRSAKFLSSGGHQPTRAGVVSGPRCHIAQQRLGRYLLCGRLPGRGSESALDVINYDLLEIGCDRWAAQRHCFFAVDENRRGWLLAGPRQGDADIGVLGLARTIDDTAHHRDVEALDARVTRLPFGHRVADEVLNICRELLKSRRSGAAAARTGRNERHECA